MFSSRWVIICSAIIAAVVAAVVVTQNSGHGESYAQGQGLLTPRATVAEEEYIPSTIREPFIEALMNLSDEFEARVASTPLDTFAEILYNGTITADFTHRNHEMRIGGTTRGTATILADGANMTYAATAVIGLMGGFMNVDMELYIDPQIAALRSSLTGAAFHGITYSTFESDIEHFGRAAQLDRATINQLINTVSGLEMALSSDFPSFDTPLIADAEGLADFLLGFEYEYYVNYDDKFLRVLLDSDDVSVFINSFDETFAPFLELALAEYSSIYEMISDLGAVPNESQLFFRINGERLMSVDILIPIEADEFNYRIAIRLIICDSCEYGEWALGVDLMHPSTLVPASPPIWSQRIRWYIYDTPASIAHNLRLSSFGDNVPSDAMSFTISWPKYDGRFEISTIDNTSSRTFQGSLIQLEHGGFNLLFDDIELSETTTLSLELDAIPGGVSIEPPAQFINLDQWSPAIMDTIGFIMDLVS